MYVRKKKVGGVKCICERAYDQETNLFDRKRLDIKKWVESEFSKWRRVMTKKRILFGWKKSDM